MIAFSDSNYSLLKFWSTGLISNEGEKAKAGAKMVLSALDTRELLL